MRNRGQLGSRGRHIMSMRGQVKWVDSKKGFGFIVTPDRDEDIFVHYTEIGGDGFRKLDEEEPVEFGLVEGEKGLHARNVRRLTGDDAPADGASAALSTGEAGRSPPGLSKTSARGGN